MFQELCFAIKREKSFIRLAIITNNCCLTHLIIRCLIVLLWKPNGSKKAANFSIPLLSFFVYFLLAFHFWCAQINPLKPCYTATPKSTPCLSSDLHFLGTKMQLLVLSSKTEICKIGGVKNKINSDIGPRFV